jgi:hypothetical protein
MANSSPLSPGEKSDLVAYLDGELRGEQARAVATRLTLSGEVRAEAHGLEATWELLDYLPRPQAPANLTEHTLRMVRGEDDARGATQRATAKPHAGLAWVRRLGPLGVVAAAAALGFIFTRWMWPDRAERLARDLSMAQNLDLYREIGSFDFLMQLDRARVGLPPQEP